MKACFGMHHREFHLGKKRLAFFLYAETAGDVFPKMKRFFKVSSWFMSFLVRA